MRGTQGEEGTLVCWRLEKWVRKVERILDVGHCSGSSVARRAVAGRDGRVEKRKARVVGVRAQRAERGAMRMVMVMVCCVVVVVAVVVSVGLVQLFMSS